MSLRRIILVLIALLASGTTVFVGRAWIQQAQREHAPQPEVVAAPPKPAPMVLVAKGNLPTGQFMRPENVRWQPWPEDGIAANYVVSGQRQVEDFLGAVVRTGLSDGEPITDGRVVRPGDRGFMAAVLTPGDRAVTVPVTPSSGIAGFVFPGDRVDLILTYALKDDAEKAGEHHASETVISDIRVLAVDQRADDQNKEIVVAKTATLEVTPKQAEIVAVVSDLGKLSLSLRSLAAVDPATEDEVTKRISYTLDSDATHLIRPPNGPGASQKVSVVRGGDVKEVEFARSIK